MFSQACPWVDSTLYNSMGVMLGLICAVFLCVGSAMVCAGHYWRQLCWADADRACDHQDAAVFIRETERMEAELLRAGVRHTTVRALLAPRYGLPGGGKAMPEPTGVWVGAA